MTSNYARSTTRRIFQIPNAHSSSVRISHTPAHAAFWEVVNRYYNGGEVTPAQAKAIEAVAAAAVAGVIEGRDVLIMAVSISLPVG